MAVWDNWIKDGSCVEGHIVAHGVPECSKQTGYTTWQTFGRMNASNFHANGSMFLISKSEMRAFLDGRDHEMFQMSCGHLVCPQNDLLSRASNSATALLMRAS